MIVITLCLLFREHIKWQDGRKKLLLRFFKVFANRAKRKYYWPSKEVVCTCLNFMVCYFVSKIHSRNKGHFKRLPLFVFFCFFCFCRISIPHHTSRRWVLNGSIIVQQLSHVCLFATLWTPAHQVPLFMGFPRQEYWSSFPLPSLEDFLDPGIKSLFPKLAGRFITTETPGKPKQQYTPLKTSLIRKTKIFLFGRENGDLTCKEAKNQ